MKIVFKTIKIIAIPLFSLMLLTEVLFRFCYHNKFSFNKEFPYQIDSVIGYRFKSNSEGYFRNEAINNNYYYFNSKGFPGGNFSFTKNNSYYRIIVVGSSNEIGFLTNGPLNYVKIIKDSLENNDIKVEIINCSIDGGNRELSKLKFVEGECLKYNPDLVLYTGRFPFDERNRYRTSYKGIKIELESPDSINSAKRYIDENITQKCLLVRLIDISYVVRGMCRYYVNKKYVDGKKDHDIYTKILNKTLIKDEEIIWAYMFSKLRWKVQLGYSVKYTEEESLSKLKIAAEKLNKNNVEFIYYKIFHNKYYFKSKELFSNKGIKYLQLDMPFKSDYSFGEKDGHLSQKAHIDIAKHFYKSLTDSIIPTSYFP
jgi:hypothetical protein